MLIEIIFKLKEGIVWLFFGGGMILGWAITLYTFNMKILPKITKRFPKKKTRSQLEAEIAEKDEIIEKAVSKIAKQKLIIQGFVRSNSST